LTLSLPPLVYRWDLDKTYLRTEFDRARDLVRTAFQKAHEKQSVPGAAALLQALGAHPRTARVDFISGSPEQLRKVLSEKLHLDGIRVDGFTLKPNLQNLLKGRFGAIRDQVGYKLPALLEARQSAPADAEEFCFGDDAEADAFIYRLYGDVVAGRFTPDQLRDIMLRAGAHKKGIERTVMLLGTVTTDRDPVRRIFIHLDRHSPTSRFDAYGARVVPIYNYFQAALVLFDDGILDAADVVRVALEMVRSNGYSIRRLANSFEDLLRRGCIGADMAARFEANASEAMKDVPGSEGILTEFRRRVRSAVTQRQPDSSTEEPLNYGAILDSGPLKFRLPGTH